MKRHPNAMTSPPITPEMVTNKRLQTSSSVYQQVVVCYPWSLPVRRVDLSLQTPIVMGESPRETATQIDPSHTATRKKKSEKCNKHGDSD